MSEMKAKRSSVMDNLFKELRRGFLEKEVECYGHKFVLRTPTEDDSVWIDGFIRISTPAAMISSERAPSLAAAIKSMDGIPLDQLFLYPDDMSETVRKGMEANEMSKRYWLYSQMMYFFIEDTNRPFVDALWAHYRQLLNERDEAINSIPKA